MRILLIINLLILFNLSPLYSSITKSDLRYVMPAATWFSPKSGNPLIWKSFKGNTLIGACFLTTDILPSLSRIYGPVKILIGLYKTGRISGIKILYLPKKLPEQQVVRTPFFEIQFIGKSIFSDFTAGKDINSISGATVTIKTISLFIKKSSIKVYNNYFDLNRNKPVILKKRNFKQQRKNSTPETRKASYTYSNILLYALILILIVLLLLLLYTRKNRN